MPDYDLKNIPVLEDVIEIEETDPAEQETIDTLAPDEVDNNFDLFIDNSTEEELSGAIDTADIEIEDFNEEVATDYIAVVDDNTQTADPVFDEPASEQEPTVDAASPGSSPFESAPIDYPTDTDNEPQPTAKQAPVSLEHIVNDVIEQLMPDLEQQLRSLVQQALEDKLPENIIKQASDETEH